MFLGRFVLGTLLYENLGDGLSQGRFVRGRIVRVPKNHPQNKTKLLLITLAQQRKAES
jgi:hypothetical protein